MSPYGVTLELDSVPIVESENETAHLRPLAAEDAVRIVEMARDEQVRRWANMPNDMTVAMAEHQISRTASAAESGRDIRWAICAVGSDEFMGSIQITPQPQVAHAVVGYEMHPDARGQGLCTAALRLACQWWFSVGGVRVYWTALVGNDASWRVAEKCGFELHATLPDYLPDAAGLPAAAWVASLAAP